MDAPKPKPPVKMAEQIKVELIKPPFVRPPHLTHQPFRNRGMADLKINLKRR